MKKVTLSALIVTYNNENHIFPCLFSLPWNTIPMEAVLVDNRSRDRTREKIESFCRQYPESLVKKIHNPVNQGFAHAVNQAVAQCEGDFILLLGPDTKVSAGALKTLILFLETHPSAGLVAPQILNGKGDIQPSCRRFPTYRDVLLELSGLPRLFPRRFFPRWKMHDFDHRHESEVQQPEATCLMTSRKALQDVGGLDEQFPMFFNDVDWCRRFRAKGWKIFFTPRAKIHHQKGASVFPHYLPMIWKSHQGFYRYFQKYAVSPWQKAATQVLGFLLIFTALIRSLSTILKHEE